MSVQERLYNADEMWAIALQPENAGRRLELIEGTLYEMAPTGWLHGDVAWLLALHLGNHVLQHNLGRVTAAETGYILHEQTILAPDVGFISAARIPAELPERFVPFAPDLAVEVVSPGNSEENISLKVELYLRYGTRLVWVIYPKQQKAHVYRPGEEAGAGRFRFLGASDALDGEDVVPNFRLSLREVFASRKPR